MTADPPPVTVAPPNLSGGRSVHTDGTTLGLAHSVADLVDLLSTVGLELGPDEVATTRLIHWQGGGPAVWAESPP
ncbi:hypothetical protein [Streptomyces ficellus]|uniref:Uncharacterized protein n=1 Tax=Streptomyces ficellus TaxID=1977088 RepID=A0A6I6FF57_9ACTN|nr:hypothetical protein [Streptomyces ficellus]QGV79697.1 hypothetical protein EIZ62_16695 [Streptomyces ficellus]